MATIQPEYFSELPRYKQLTKFRQYLDSKQYEGKPDFFTGQHGNSGEVKPLRERKPCIIYPLPRSAVNQVIRFTFGESRFPRIGVEEIDNENSIADQKLSAEEAEQLEKFLDALVEQCHLKPLMRRLMRPGLATGTACALLSLKLGKIVIDIANAEDVLPEFRDGDPNLEVVRAVWCYKYFDTVNGLDGKPERKEFWFRQDFTDKAYLEYARVEVKPNERPQWTVSRTVTHDFGFCPVVWVRNITESDSRQVDGTSLYDNLLDEFDALNFALSQRHRGIYILGTPQPWETGVEEDDGPQLNGRQARVDSEGYSSPHGKRSSASQINPARPSGPHQMWTYRGKDAKVGLLETTGKAFEAATMHVNDIRGRALESMGVVLVNVSEVMGKTQAGEMSAKFLELAYEPLMALVDEMRHCWWPNGLQAILSQAMRIVAARKGKGIYIPGAEQAAQILERFNVKTDDDGMLWLPPKLVPSWGDYFAPGGDEIKVAVETAQAAKDAGLVPAADASKFVLPYFGREDENEAIDELEAEADAAAENAANDLAHEATTLHAVSEGKKPPAPPVKVKAKRGDSTKPGSAGKARRGKSSKNAGSGSKPTGSSASPEKKDG